MTIVPPEGPPPFDQLRQVAGDGSECWSARDLQPVFGYERWERLDDAIQRAIAACENSGHDPADHFRGAAKNPSGLGGRPAKDWLLSRYAAYLLAMNGDPRKPQIAAAQTYFAVRTREAEVAAQLPALTDPLAELEIQTQRTTQAIQIAKAERARAEVAELKVRELEPSAQAWDVLASAAGDYSLRDSAFILNRDPAIDTGQQRLMKLIRALNMVDRNDVPYARHASHLTERAQSYTHPRTQEEVLAKPQIRITVQGLRYLHGKLGGEGSLQLPMRDAS